MKVTILNQPFKAGRSLYATLVEWLSNEQLDRIDIAVAWVKRSGLQLLIDQIRAFKARGGSFNVVTGISAGGATRQGLTLAQSLADSCAVFYHPPSRTFHPKLYLGTGRDIAYAVVGSQNLTRGGLTENFELGVEMRFDLQISEDREQFEILRSSITAYLESGSTMILTEDSLAALLGNPFYGVGDEDNPPKRSSPSSTADSSSGNSLFGISNFDLSASAASQGNPPRRVIEEVDPIATANLTASSRTEASGSDTQVLARWYKKLSAADAQHPVGARTNPTGHVTLVQAHHPISSATWFREFLFNTNEWHGTKQKQLLSIKAQVVIDDRELGEVSISISHTPSFQSGQNNRVTTLHWGSALGPQIKKTNHAGKYLTIERLGNGCYRLIIGRSPAGSFIG
jgi:HKD family nuclease